MIVKSSDKFGLRFDCIRLSIPYKDKCNAKFFSINTILLSQLLVY